MTTLTVWKFDTATGADEAVATIEPLSKQELITVHDAATVSWGAEKKKPKTRQLISPVPAPPELIQTNLSDEEEAKLREAFVED